MILLPTARRDTALLVCRWCCFFAFSLCVPVACAVAQTASQTPAQVPDAAATPGQAERAQTGKAGMATPPPPAANQPALAATKPEEPMHPDAMQDWIQNWADLNRYRQENAALPVLAPGELRVVFMGDSITQNWLQQDVVDFPPGPVFFPGKPYINRGISGQTTPQILLRFRQDVIDLKPAVVVILAGINDIAANSGEMSAEETENNLASMTDLAHEHSIRVVLCSILPAMDFPWSPGRNPAPKVVLLNRWIKAYAAAQGYVYVDFYSAMTDEFGGLPASLSHDGVHPNKAGYDIMNPLVEAGIAQALAAK